MTIFFEFLNKCMVKLCHWAIFADDCCKGCIVCLGHGVILLLFLFSSAVSVYVEAYDNWLAGPVAQYTALCQKIGGDVQKHVRNAALSL